MRILFLSNFFPPARPGGYTQWCHEVAEHLQKRGHTIGVLTSRHEQAKALPDEQNVYRLLHLEGDLIYYRPLHFFTKWKKQHRENLAFLEQIVKDFAPDLLFVWGMWALSRALPALAEQLLPGRVVYYLSDYWPSTQNMHTTYWEAPPNHWYMRFPKGALRFVASQILAHEKHPILRFENAVCVSNALKRHLIVAGLPLEHARVIHGGTDVERFKEEGNEHLLDGPLRLLYAGQIAQHKGVHTAIEAIAKLVNGHGNGNVQLTIMGTGHPGYESCLRHMVAAEGLHDVVHFRAPVTREEIPVVLREHSVLIFPSIYEEPLARMTQEAMASALIVIGTTTGGTAEILRDGQNGLTFPAGDSDALVRQVKRLLLEPGLAARLAAAGRQSVLEYFNLERMVNEIETYLQAVAERNALPRLARTVQHSGR